MVDLGQSMLKKPGDNVGAAVVHGTNRDLQHLLHGKKRSDRQWRDLDWNADPLLDQRGDARPTSNLSPEALLRLKRRGKIGLQ